uniref:SIAH-type domain-containing protein n=2 Tax=Timema TaxID=61471 RepID=A0A7R9D6C1_TIMPO|nr:unnamed protein product [Timema douglasi]CAD7407802.1 unnamed protein product [Timema poppensis]
MSSVTLLESYVHAELRRQEQAERHAALIFDYTPSQSTERLEYQATRQASMRAAEKPLQTQLSSEEQAERQRALRATETLLQTQIRLDVQAERQVNLRATETPYQMQHRLDEQDEQQRALRATETPLQTQLYLEEEYHAQPQRDSCRYQPQGCLKNLRSELMVDHEPSCEYQPTTCPLANHPQCPWGGKLRNLDRHLREAHDDVIVPGAERCHLVEVHKVRANKSVCFVQETQEKLYVISVHCKGRLLMCTIQVVPMNPPERVGSLMGALEVVGVDGKPHGWMGKIRSLHDPVESLWDQGHCLRVDPNIIGACSRSTIRLHALVMLQTPCNRGRKRRKVARPSAKRRIASRT